MSASVYWPGVTCTFSKRRWNGPTRALPTRCTTRGWRSVNGLAAIHAATTTAMATAKITKPSAPLLSRAANIALRFRAAPVAKTIVTCMTMNTTNQTITRKCTERASWMLNTLLNRRNRVDSAGDMPNPVISASGAATNTVMK
jgi:hypothetical protein